MGALPRLEAGCNASCVSTLSDAFHNEDSESKESNIRFASLTDLLVLIVQ